MRNSSESNYVQEMFMLKKWLIDTEHVIWILTGNKSLSETLMLHNP